MDYAMVDGDGVVLNIARFDSEATATSLGYTVKVHHDDNSKQVGRGWTTKDNGQTWNDQRETYHIHEVRDRMSKKLGSTPGVHGARRIK